MSELRDTAAALLKESSDRETALQKVLVLVLETFRSETGTLHLLDRSKQVLHLAAQCGLPETMLDVVRLIPVGKGIAGQTVAQGAAVTICNLQMDSSGVARPGARRSGVRAALCVPVRRGEQIVGTLGIGTVRPGEYTPEETQALEDLGRLIGDQLTGPEC